MAARMRPIGALPAPRASPPFGSGVSGGQRNVRRFRARGSSSSSSVDVQSRQPAPLPPGLEFRTAGTAAELRSAAYLRACSFYSYPPGRSEFAARSHRRLKGDAEWEAVTAKVEGRDPEYARVVVSCLIGTIPQHSDSPLVQQLLQELEASAKLPAAGGNPPGLVVATLDINQGGVLPAEELTGRLPEEGADTLRAYLSNVCVAPAARRSGIGAALLAAAERAAAAAGVHWLYVHVVAANAPAARLYERAGFQVEGEETEAYARVLQRPRRLLLRKQLPRDRGG